MALAGCTGSANQGGQTPAPSPSSVSAANSTAAPDIRMAPGPGGAYFAKTGADNGVTFEIWANGSPVTSLQWPNKSVNITSKMRGHANVIAIRWTKTKKNGTGTLAVVDSRGKKIVAANVTAASPAKSEVSHTFIAPQAPGGR